ncbi:MAG: HD domain-containing protein [Clostridia bacterium]|nr:HD domain-containing protein [Clostridia bacterium]
MYSKIREYLKNNLSEKRYIHTLAVSEECSYFADIFDLGEKERSLLQRAALFHDITKEKTPDEHIALCRVYNIEFDKAYISTPALFHSLTGGEFAHRLFPSECTDEVVELIKTHTTGGENMTLLQKILFIADSTEATRKHESCIELRNYFHSNAAAEDPKILLDRTIVKSIDSTMGHLICSRKPIAAETVKARNYLLMNSEVLL